jgi:hypothetical protein
MRLDSRTCADHGALLDFHKRPDENVVAKPAAIKIAGLGYGDARSERDIYDACPANVRSHLDTKED